MALRVGFSGVVFAALALIGPQVARAGEPSPVGFWRTIDEKTGAQTALIEIREAGDVLVGRIVKIMPRPGESPNPICKKCDEPDTNRPVVGLTILKGFKRDGDEWDGGTILDPRSGDVYSSELRLDDGGKKLLVRGYIGISLLGRTETWLRED